MPPRAARVLDAVLNAGFAFLVLLFVTGGLLPADYARDRGEALEPWRMGPWVAGFLLLVLLRRLGDREGRLPRLWFVRVLRALGARLAASPRAIYVVTALWAVLLAAVAIRQHWAFADGRDIEVFDQALWNTTQGRFYRASIVGDVMLLAEHFDPLNLALVPLYLVHPSPVILLVAQAAMIALGAVPLYWLARARFPGQALAALFPLVYLFYLPLREANRFGYHPGALVPPLFLFALYFMERARWGWMVCFLGLAGLLKENMPIAGAAIGLYLFFTRRQRVLGGVLAVLFGAWFYAGFAWIIPAFGRPGGYKYFDLFTTLEPSASGLFLAPLRNPAGFLAGLLAYPERKIVYLVQVFAPLAFLPLLSPSRLAIGLPFLIPHLLTSIRLMTTVRTHHTADLAPFVFFAALAGAGTLLDWLAARPAGRPRSREALSRGLCALLLATSFLFHGWSEVLHFRRNVLTPHHRRLHEVLGTVPPDASVSAHPFIAPHLSHRRALYRFPDLGPGGAVDLVVLDRRLVDRETYRKAFDEAVAALPGRGYEKILDEDGILVFRRRA